MPGRKQTASKWKTVPQRLLLIAGLAAAIAVLGGCPTRRFFGVSCPGCGMTRACLSLFQLDFQAAFDYHPLVFVLAPALLYFVFREVLPFTLSRKMEMVLLGAFFAALVFVYCYRKFILHATILETDFTSSVLDQIISGFRQIWPSN